MKKNDFEILLDVIKNKNPDNNYINNKGLNEFGRILFYPQDKEKDNSYEFHQYLELFYGPEKYKILIDTLKKYHFSSYYTNKEIIQNQIDFIKSQNLNPKTILEPSAGNGAYVQLLKKNFPEAKIVALEPDFFSYDILRLNNDNDRNVTCLNTTFEEYLLKHKNENLEKFDLVMTNVPFGPFKIQNIFKHSLENSSEKNINVFFNKYPMQLLNEKGIAMLITSKNFADKPSYAPIRESVLQKNDLLGAYRFNNELFKEENTKVVSDLFIYQKNSFKKELSKDEQLFIQTTPVTFEKFDKDLYINEYFNSNKHFINGTIKPGIFHQQPDITIEKDIRDNATFLKDNLTWINKLDFKITQVSQDNKEEVKIDDAISSNLNDIEAHTALIPKENILAQQPIDKQDQLKIKPINATLKLITLADGDYLKNNTKLYNGSYNFDNHKIVYYSSLTQKREITNKRIQSLLNFYIPLRNEFVVFNDNLMYKRYDKDALKKAFNNLDYALDTFHFQSGHLGQYREILENDFYFKKMLNTLEQVKLIENKVVYQKNPEFSLEKFNKNLEEVLTNTSFSSFSNSSASNDNIDTNSNDPEQVNNLDLLSLSYQDKFPSFSLDPNDDLFLSIKKYHDNNGRIDIEPIAQLYNTTPNEILQEAFDKKIAFFNPIFNDHDQFVKYEMDFFFVLESGNIDQKIQTFNNIDTPYPINKETVINYLDSIKNAHLPITDIEFNFESHFIPKSIKEDFFFDITNENISILVGQFSQNVNLLFSKEHNQNAHEIYSIEPSEGTHIKGSLSYKSIFQNFAENTYPTVYYPVKDGDKTIYKIDAEGTVAAHNKYEQLQLEFKSFIHNNEKYKQIIEKAYYDAFLADKELKINSDILFYPKTLVHSPYEHQLNSVLYSLKRGTALIDHKVGHGKSVSMGLLCYKLLQHRKAKRIVLSTLKAVSEDIYKELQINFPTINFFLLNAKNFSAKKRNETLNFLKNSDVDVILCEHTHLPLIPKSKEAIEYIYNKNLNMIDQDLEAAKMFSDVKESKNIIKGLERRKETLSEKFNAKIDKLDKKQITDVTFEDLNIEALLVDECHEFKNIQYTTRHQNVSGLNSSMDSEKNFDMEINIRSIHSRVGSDKNVFFYSGTPVLNSVTEVYAYKRYLIPRELEKKNISNFDSWASIFLRQSVQAESNIFGEARMHKRFRYFTNMPELSKMYRSFTHISDENTFKTHTVEVVKEFRILDSTAAYDQLRDASILFARDKNQQALFGYQKYTDEAMVSSYVTALGINRKMLVDPFLEKNLAIEFDESDQHKLLAACQDIKFYYDMTNQDKGVVMVFSDIGVFKANEYNTYQTVKNILVEKHNIPDHEIGFAQEYKEKNKMNEFKDKIRNGIIRVPIGSTKVLGTGVNAQDRVIACLALDIPYGPHADQQREGRMARKGNWIHEKYGNKGYYITYGIKDSTDIFSNALNKHKTLFIKQLKEINNQRVYDDFFTNMSEMSYAQKEAMLIGDMDTFKLVKLEDDCKALKMQKQLFDISKNNAQKKVDSFSSINQNIVSKINTLQKTNDHIHQYIPVYNANHTEKEIQLESLKLFNKLLEYNNMYTYSSFKEINEKINFFMLNIGSSKNTPVFSFPLSGFDLIFSKNNFANNKYYSFDLKLHQNDIIIPGKAQVKFDNTKLLYQFFRTVKKIPDTIKNLSRDLDFNLKSIESNKKILKSSFPAEKLDNLKDIEKQIKSIKRKKGLKS